MAKLKSVIGFEADTAEIRAIELAKVNGAVTVLACGKIPLPEGAIEEGFIRDAGAFNQCLADLLQNGNFKSTDVVVGVNNENVIILIMFRISRVKLCFVTAMTLLIAIGRE